MNSRLWIIYLTVALTLLLIFGPIFLMHGNRQRTQLQQTINSKELFCLK